MVHWSASSLASCSVCRLAALLHDYQFHLGCRHQPCYHLSETPQQLSRPCPLDESLYVVLLIPWFTDWSLARFVARYGQCVPFRSHTTCHYSVQAWKQHTSLLIHAYFFDVDWFLVQLMAVQFWFITTSSFYLGCLLGLVLGSLMGTDRLLLVVLAWPIPSCR